MAITCIIRLIGESMCLWLRACVCACVCVWRECVRVRVCVHVCGVVRVCGSCYESVSNEILIATLQRVRLNRSTTILSIL